MKIVWVLAAISLFNSPNSIASSKNQREFYASINNLSREVLRYEFEAATKIKIIKPKEKYLLPIYQEVQNISNLLASQDSPFYDLCSDTSYKTSFSYYYREAHRACMYRFMVSIFPFKELNYFSRSEVFYIESFFKIDNLKFLEVITSKLSPLIIEKIIATMITKNISPQINLLSTISPNIELTTYLHHTRYFDLGEHQRNLLRFRDLYVKIRNKLNAMEWDEDTEQFIQELTTIVPSNPEQIEDYYSMLMLIGKMLDNRALPIQARSIYNLAYRIPDKEKSENAMFSYLWTYLREHRYKSALREFYRFGIADQLEEASANISFWFGISLFQSGLKEKSKSIFNSIILKNPVSYYSIISIHILENYFNSSVTDSLIAQFFKDSEQADQSPSFDDETVKALSILDFFMEHKDFRLATITKNKIISLTHENINSLDRLPANIEKNQLKNGLVMKLASKLNRHDEHLMNFKLLYSSMNNQSLKISNSILDYLFPTSYKNYIYHHADEVDPAIILSLIRQESAFNPHAISSAGALGLMQLMPKTAREVRRKVSRRQLFRPEDNIKIGIKYFSQLYHKYDRNLIYALSAYNAGEKNLAQWKEYFFRDESPLHIIENIPFDETQKYVKLIFRNLFFYKILEKREAFDSDEFFQQFLSLNVKSK